MSKIPNIPRGWKLVPLRPTSEMIAALHNGWQNAKPDGEYQGQPITSMYAMHLAAYKAMIAAVPNYRKRK